MKIEIDGKTLDAENGEMIIQVADRAGIPIPRFCYHKKLSIAANCRMCLVEVEKAPKVMPACATPVAEGMKVMTCSDKARMAQKAVMEFLLINHPLDCPICDQGGECELQDVSLGYGEDVSRYNQGKRSVDDKNIGPLIETEMTRCIHCTRCVRFGQEIAGIPELGCTGRGENTEIGTYIEKSLVSEVSANVIDLCPVGALTNKPFRYQARAWELNQHANVSPHDCLGTNIYVHERRGQVMRVIPRENEAINETWIADRDRFSYLGLSSPDRLTEPRIKLNGQWKTVDWLTALKTAVSGLGQVLERQGPAQVGGVIHPNCTLEEHYLFQKWLRALKVNNIDHQLQLTEKGLKTHALPRFEVALKALPEQQAIFLVGSNIRSQQPIAGLKVRQAQLNGAVVSVLNSLDYDFHFAVANKCIAAPVDFVAHCAAIAKAACVSGGEFDRYLTSAKASAEASAIAAELKQADKACIIIGAQVLNHPQASLLRGLLYAIADATHARVNEFPEGGNAMAAHLTGCVPAADSMGLATSEMFAKELAAYVLMNVEAETDIANANEALSALDNARFVVQITPFVTTTMEMVTDVMLPMAPFTETSGTYVNMETTWQSVQATINAQGQARPGWKILRVLGNLCQLPDFEYTSSVEVRDECEQALKQSAPQSLTIKTDFAWADKPTESFWRLCQLPAYRCDNVVRRAIPLQEVAGTDKAMVYLNPQAASSLDVVDNDWLELEQDNFNIRAQVKLDARVPEHCVYTPAGFVQTNLSTSHGFIAIRSTKR